MVSSWVHFTPLADDGLFEALIAWHPLLANTDRHLLARLDERDAKATSSPTTLSAPAPSPP